MRKSLTLITFALLLAIGLCIGLCIPKTNIADASAIDEISLIYYDNYTGNEKTTIVTTKNSKTQDKYGGPAIDTLTFVFADDYNSTTLVDTFGLTSGTNVSENNSKYVATNFDWDFVLENFIVKAYDAEFGEGSFYADSQTPDNVIIKYNLAYEIDGFRNTPYENDISYYSDGGYYRLGNEYSGYETFDNFTKDNTLLLTDITESHNIKLYLLFSFEKYIYNEYGGYDFKPYYVLFDMPAISVAPYKDGDIAYCSSVYSEGCEQILPETYLLFDVSDDLFDVNYGHTMKDYTYSWYYIVNDSACIALETIDFSEEEYSTRNTVDTFLLISEYPEIPYTIRGKLIITSVADGTKTTFYTNKITVQKYNFEIKTNNIYSLDVTGGKEYVFSLSINRGEVKLLNENAIEWIFSLYNDDVDIEDKQKTGQNISYTFPKRYNESNNEIAYSDGIEINMYGLVDEYTAINLSQYRFSNDTIAVNNPGVNVNLDESTRVVPSYNLTFNVPDNSAMVIGGDEVDIFAEINEFYGDEDFELSYVLSSNGTVADLSDTKDKLRLHATQEGKATIICTATSVSAGTFTKSLTINVIEKTDSNTKIVFSDSFHTSKNIVAYLSIAGFTSFINYTPSWNIVNEDNEEISFVENSDGSVSISNASNNTYSFSVLDSVATVPSQNIILSDNITPAYNITFNVENNSAMIIGGNTIDIIPTINEVYGDENFTINYTISGTAFAENISTTDGVITLNALATGKVTISVVATSESAGMYVDTLVINVIEKTNDNTKLGFTNSFHTTKNIVAYLNIAGFTKFLNYTPIWTIKKDTSSLSYVQNTDGTISLNNVENGTYSFLIDDNSTYICKSIYVSDVENPIYRLSFNIDNNLAMVVGGSEINIVPQINEIYGDEEFKITYTISGVNYANDLSSVDGTITLHAISKGKVSIFATASSESAGTYTNTLTVNILEATADNVSITFNNSFHKTGSDVIAYLNIDGFTSFLNYNPTWVLKQEGDEDTLLDVEFTTNTTSDYALLSTAPKGYYQYSVNDEIVKTDTVRIRVTNVDFAKVAKKSLPYVAIVMVIAIIIALLIKHKLYKLNTVERHLGKVEDFLGKKSSEMLQTSDKFQHDMTYVETELKHALNKANELDHESLGQHQALVSQLTKALNIALSAKKCAKKLDKDAMNKISVSLLEKYIKPSKKLAEDLTSAIQKYNIEKAGSAETVDPAKPKRKKKNDGDYLEALKEFYHKGDEFDQTNDIEEKN